jgi:hypothetical protein
MKNSTDRRVKGFGNYNSREELTAAIHSYKETLNITDTAKNVGVSKTTCLRILRGDEPSYNDAKEREQEEESLLTIFHKYWITPNSLKEK